MQRQTFLLFTFFGILCSLASCRTAPVPSPRTPTASITGLPATHFPPTHLPPTGLPPTQLPVPVSSPQPTPSAIPTTDATELNVFAIISYEINVHSLPDKAAEIKLLAPDTYRVLGRKDDSWLLLDVDGKPWWVISGFVQLSEDATILPECDEQAVCRLPQIVVNTHVPPLVETMRQYLKDTLTGQMGRSLYPEATGAFYQVYQGNNYSYTWDPAQQQLVAMDRLTPLVFGKASTIDQVTEQAQTDIQFIMGADYDLSALDFSTHMKEPGSSVFFYEWEDKSAESHLARLMLTYADTGQLMRFSNQFNYLHYYTIALTQGGNLLPQLAP
ncbi:MAG TPA: hypothetical protein PK299_04990 [Anaerolineales bacterium]|nr:hypothetical protein [Anaerolineales bacterium]